jgi:threonine synthase
MKYLSTRGTAPVLNFKDAMLAGLASDGGLYVPETLPQFSPAEISALARLNYQELAHTILMPFVGDAFSQRALRGMIASAYAGFRHQAVAPLTQLSHGHFLLELFHGPTLAFKDFALQLLGHLMEATLADSGKKSVVLGATSGDTGSAAIHGLLGRKNIEIVILYPNGRTSQVQRRQMTTTGNPHVHALAVEGTFDDCQTLVKDAFTDAALRGQVNLLAVNSINWARVMAQIVYYFYAALALGAPAARVNFSVPTGNFGDIFAGYLARQMGLPIGTLMIASNRNDILTRTLHTGEYRAAGVAATLSPSMDIQVASNFERLLFDLHGRDAARIAQMMQAFRATGSLTLTPSAHAMLRSIFTAHSVSDQETLTQMKATYAASGLLLDPHTAVGVNAAQGLEGMTITLATAHPAKFPDAVQQATGITPALPAHMADLYQREEVITPLANDAVLLREYLTGL